MARLTETRLINPASAALPGPRPGTVRRPAALALRPALAVTALVAFLAVSWVADFRYAGMRSVPTAHPWPPVAAEWRHNYEVSRTGAISAEVPHGYTTILCDRLRF